jgi:hypothetical protein
VVATINRTIKPAVFVEDYGILTAVKVKIGAQEWTVLRREIQTRDEFAKLHGDLIDDLAAGKHVPDLAKAHEMSEKDVKSIKSAAKALGLLQ